MSAYALLREDEFPTAFAAVVAGLSGPAAEAARRSGFAVVLGGALPRCDCPGDCDRDHDNE
jgi:hypothetical protein